MGQLVAKLLGSERKLNTKLMGMFVALCLVVGSVVGFSHAATANVTVDFGTVIQGLAPYPFSGTISTYGSGGGSIAVNAKQRTNLGNLGLGLYRVPLQYNGGNVISSAGGGPTNISGDTWISSIKSYGGTPEIVIGGSSDNNFSASDAAGLVHHFNDNNANRVDYWIVGNEPGNGGMDISTYCTLFNSAYTAMKAADPTIKIGGPAWAFYDSNTLQSFLNCAGSKADIIDYHHYGMGTTYLDNATALSQTGNWETEVSQARQMINSTVPSRASQIQIQVGEYNWSWRTGDGYNGYNGDDRFYEAVATVWGASVAGHIAKAGGRGHQYSDQNGALGITFENSTDASHFGRTIDDPMPIYYGMQMFSGGNLFRAFGSQMVSASSALSNVEVFASTNSKNIVLINKGTTAQSAVVQTTGVASGTAAIWQTDQNAPFAAPANKGTATISSSQLSVALPAYSVTTLVVAESAATPTPTPTVTYNAADLNHDGHVNVYDLSALLTNWGKSGSGDINGSGTVDIYDLSKLLSSWTG